MRIYVTFNKSNIKKSFKNEQLKCPTVNGWAKKLWYMYTMKFRSRKKGETSTLCDSMDGTGEHHAT